MSTVTEYYGITGPVPFINVEIKEDNRLYLDPHAVRLTRSPQPFAGDAVHCADTFLAEITHCVISRTRTSLDRAERLLQRFGEPWETRLGMSEAGFHGHGGAEVVGTWILDTLTDDVEALIRVAVLRHLEDLPLFVDGVDRDITSDITTRIIYGPLARFTEAMIATYPQFRGNDHEVRRFRRQVWDPAKREWAVETFILPVANGKPLLLVPKGWARRTLLMSATRYYETSVLTYAQLERAVMGSDGKLIRTPKDRLKSERDLARGRATNLNVTLRAFENEQDLLAVFKAFVASKFEPEVEMGGDENAVA